MDKEMKQFCFVVTIIIIIIIACTGAIIDMPHI
jgi:hypothetical protein